MQLHPNHARSVVWPIPYFRPALDISPAAPSGGTVAGLPAATR